MELHRDRVLVEDERGADLGGERLHVVADGLHVGVLRDGPEALGVRVLVPEHGRLAAQQVELVVRDALGPRVLEQVDVVEVISLMRSRLLG